MSQQQLIEIATGNVVQEFDDAAPLPVFGGVWGDSSQYKWQPAPAARKLEIAKFFKLARIQGEHKTLLEAGVTYSGVLFQSDSQSISTLSEVLTAISSGWAIPSGFAWVDAANTAHPATIAFLKALSTAFANHKAALFSRLFIAKNKINQANTIKAVNAVVL